MNQDARYKLLRCSFSQVCNAGVLLEDKEVTLFTKLSSINVSETGISLEPAFNGSISMGALNIKQPLSKQSSLPTDFLPNNFNVTPRKTFDLPIIAESKDLVGLTISLGSFLVQ